MTGAQIRAARGFLDWSVRDLGKKAKVHFNTVHAIERGKSVAKPETLAAIRKALEKTGVEFTNGRPTRRAVCSIAPEVALARMANVISQAEGKSR
jgi:transcriptional regulator with XRE-family HTH domain